MKSLFSSEGARQVSAQFALVRKALPTLASAFWVPGRIELVGKHVDYAGGQSVVAAVERGLVLGMAPRDVPGIRVLDLDRQEGWIWTKGGLLVEGGLPDGFRSARGWRRYPETLLRRLKVDAPDAFDPLGVDLAFSNSLPTASGMSSSSAFLVALWLGLAARYPRLPLAGGQDPTVELAAYLAAVEGGRPFPLPSPFPVPSSTRGGGESVPVAGDDVTEEGVMGVGTEGGAQDHAAILLGRPGSLLHLGYRPLEVLGRVALPSDWIFVLGVSGVRAAKATGARARFNALAREAESLAESWRAQTGDDAPHLGAIVQRILALADAPGEPDAPGAQAIRADPRFMQFETEVCDVVPTVLEALANWDLSGQRRFADACEQSWLNADLILRNQVRETRILVDEARRLGAVAASGFGAGFGGAVWALVSAEHGSAFLERWRAAYARRVPHRASQATFLVTPPGPGAHALDLRDAPSLPGPVKPAVQI